MLATHYQLSSHLRGPRKTIAAYDSPSRGLRGTCVVTVKTILHPMPNSLAATRVGHPRRTMAHQQILGLFPPCAYLPSHMSQQHRSSSLPPSCCADVLHCGVGCCSRAGPMHHMPLKFPGLSDDGVHPRSAVGLDPTS
jgi:hypothetical protein